MRTGLPRNDQGRIAGKALAASLGGMIVFVAILVSITLTLRGSLRAQIVSRDAAVLSSMVQYELSRARALNQLYPEEDDSADDSMLETLLDVARLDGVVAFRVFDADGEFLAAAPTVFVRGGLDEADMDTLKSLKPVSHFRPNAQLDNYFYNIPGKGSAEGATASLLEVFVPIYETQAGKLEGVGQFLLDGTPTAASFAQLDRSLARQVAMAGGAGLILGGGLLGWSFLLLHRRNAILLARTRELARANRELALRSRVSAIGAVTANLLHGLKNPLAALSLYVQERRRSGEGDRDEGLEDADEAARRMGSMIEQSVAILGQESGQERFDFSLAEITEVVTGQCKQSAMQHEVRLGSSAVPDVNIDNRRGNLLTLAAVNLTHNAVEASPAGSSVRLDWTAESNRKSGACIQLRVSDAGSGLPEPMRADPFKPTHSAKKGGSGIGLAIAAQLVRQMGGELVLERTGPEGSVFSIRFPLQEEP